MTDTLKALEDATRRARLHSNADHWTGAIRALVDAAEAVVAHAKAKEPGQQVLREAIPPIDP